MGTEHVRAPAFKAFGGGRGLPVLAGVIARIGHHMPAMLAQNQLILHRAAAIEQGEPFRAEHPFVAVGHHKIRVYLLCRERQRAENLDGIHTEEYAPGTAGGADGGHVHEQPRAVLDSGERHQAGAWPHGVNDILLRVVALQIDLDHLHALVGQGLPGNAVGREFLITDDNLITSLPLQALGNDRQTFGGVLEQGDLFAANASHQPGQTLA